MGISTKGPICIKNNHVSLEINLVQNEKLTAIFHGDGVQFEIKSYLYHDAHELCLFFDQIAEKWRGWNGIKTWTSVERDFKLEAVHNGLNAVRLTVSLIKNHGADNECRFVGNISLEIASLDKLSSEVKRYFSVN